MGKDTISHRMRKRAHQCRRAAPEEEGAALCRQLRKRRLRQTFRRAEDSATLFRRIGQNEPVLVGFNRKHLPSRRYFPWWDCCNSRHSSSLMTRNVLFWPTMQFGCHASRTDRPASRTGAGRGRDARDPRVAPAPARSSPDARRRAARNGCRARAARPLPSAA